MKLARSLFDSYSVRLPFFLTMTGITSSTRSYGEALITICAATTTTDNIAFFGNTRIDDLSINMVAVRTFHE
jgi:hypothetical protein